MAGGAAAVAVAVAVAVGFAVAGDGGGRKAGGRAAPLPSAWARQAGQAVAAGPGYRFEGTLPADGRPVRAALRVTKEGSASGTLTAAGGLRADVVAVDGRTYIKAGPAFWRAYGGESARPEAYADRWAKAPASMPGLDVPDVLGSEAIAKLLVKAASRPPVENVAGVRAYRVKTPDADYLVTASAPYRLLAVQSAGPGDPTFTAAPLAAPGPLLAEIRARVAKLGGAADPALRFAPGKLSFVNCEQNLNGCTVSVPATLTSPDGAVPAGARAALRATVTSKGRRLGACTGSGPVPSNRELVLRCTVKGHAWRSWMRQALDAPGAHPYGAQARVLGEAVDPADVPALLARIDRERGASAAGAGPGAGPGGGPGASPQSGRGGGAGATPPASRPPG
ncbi:hypothetical protein [Actinomadura yumaensis]|uniref:Lipoprotein n=1 Tax=Actinomadura yumaensis TaxID=111807 RepID=A0ABW2CGL9_9ACTN